MFISKKGRRSHLNKFCGYSLHPAFWTSRLWFNKLYLIKANIKPGDNSQNLCKFNHFKPYLICGCFKCGQNIIMLKGNIFRPTNVDQIKRSACFTKETIAPLAETLSWSEVSTSTKHQADILLCGRVTWPQRGIAQCHQTHLYLQWILHLDSSIVGCFNFHAWETL